MNPVFGQTGLLRMGLCLMDTIQNIHAEIDRQTAPIENIHADRLQCRRGCCACCIDDLTVFEVEAEPIRRHYPELLTRGTPHPPGACAFLDDHGGCRIYAHRPYVCRTQGLPLRWIDELDDGTPVEMRDICPLNDEGAPIETLPEDQCWTIGPFEAELADLEKEMDGGQMRRVALRSLFG